MSGPCFPTDRQIENRTTVIHRIKVQDWAPWQRETSKFNHVTIPDYYLELGAKSQCSAVDEQSLGKPK